MKTTIFSTRISAEQRKKIERVARSHSMLSSKWARLVLIDALQKRLDVTGIDDPVRPQAGRPPRLAATAAA
jgi:hypothetical protein